MNNILAIIKNKNKLFLKNKFLIIFSILFPIIFSTFFSMIFTNYDNITKIPIAVIDNDFSITSKNIIAKLNNNDSLNLVTTDYDTSLKYIKSNRIEAIFILKENFEKNLKASNYNEIVELLYLDKSSIGPALGDIVASDIMMDLAIYKTANTAVMYNEKYKLNAENIFNKSIIISEDFIDSNFFEMNVDSKILKPSSQIIEDTDIEKILKTNITFGFSLIIMSFVILFSNANILEQYNINTNKQLLSHGYSTIKLYFAEMISILTNASIIALGQLIFYAIGLKIYDISDILILILVLFLHNLFLSNFIILFTSLLKSKLKYQSTITPILFLLGLIGGAFWSVEFLSKDIRWISYFSPIYWILKIMNNIILKITFSDISYILLIYFIFIFILTIISLQVYKKYISTLRSSN